MARSVKKAINDYNKRRSIYPEYDFYYSELQEIRQLSLNSCGTVDIYEIVGNSLKFGFEVGYRTAKREQSKLNK